MKNLVILASLLFGSFVTFAQQASGPPLISVTGEAKIMVTPDFVNINIAVENETNDAPSVKNLNDATVRKILQVCKELGIDAKDVKTDYIRLEPFYKYEERVTKFRAYQSVSINLRKLGDYDKLMLSLINSGVNRINSVEFKSNDLLQIQEKARLLAVKDAQQKARAMATEIGQNIGKAMFIEEVNHYMPVYERSAKTMMSMDASGNANEPTIALGQIVISAQVQVKFILE